MEYTTLGRTGLQVSRISLGCMSYGEPSRGNQPWSLPEDESRPVLPAGHRRRHQLLRHRERVLAGQQRGDHRPRARQVRPARGPRHRHEGAWRDAPGSEWQWSIAQVDPDRDRQQPAQARHRLRRPLPDPPLGLRRRRSRRRSRRCTTSSVRGRRATSVRRRCTPGSSARRSTSPTCTAGPDSSACRTTTTCCTAKRSAR